MAQRELKRLFYIVPVTVFVLGVIVGFLEPSEQLYSAASEKFTVLQSLPEPLQVAAIMANNIGVAAMIAAGSLLVLPGLGLLWVNGYLLGTIASLIYSQHGGAGLVALAAAIAPHGVLELPAYFYASTLGLQLLYGLTTRRRPGELIEDFLAGYYVVAAALVAAAFVEVYVTGRLVGG